MCTVIVECGVHNSIVHGFLLVASKWFCSQGCANEYTNKSGQIFSQIKIQ